MNQISSRSHAILHIMIEERKLEIEGGIKKKRHKKSLFTVVDLAGSERLAKSKSSDVRLEEAKSINKSISALGNCIKALISAKQNKHVPFRDSKLTRVLTNGLSGNSKTTLIACVSPSLIQYEESLLTLLFACRAMGVSTYAMVNEEILTQQKPKFEEGDMELVKKNTMLETENLTLQRELADLRKQASGTPRSNMPRNRSYLELTQKMSKSTLINDAAISDIGQDMTTRRKMSNPEKNLVNANMIIKRMGDVIRRLQAKIAEKVFFRSERIIIEFDDKEIERGKLCIDERGIKGKKYGFIRNCR